MEKKIEKVLRFIELSVKFSKSEYDIVPKQEEENNMVGTICSGSISLGASLSGLGTYNIQTNFCVDGRELYVDAEGNVKAKDNTPVTRAFKLKALAESKIKLLEEYEEYMTLRNELKQYFEALKKINE